MSLFGRLFGGREQRDIHELNSIPKNSDLWGSDSGEFVSERTALQSIAVYSCVRILADSIAALPTDAYRKRGKLREEVSPTPIVVAKPNNMMTPFEWGHQTVTSLALRGDSYQVVVGRDRLEFPTELEPVHPDCVEVRRDRDTGKPMYKVDGERIPSYDMLHIKRFSLPGCLTGLSPIGQARQGIGLQLAAEKYGAKWFRDSANPSAVLESEANVDEATAKITQEQWKASHGGKRHPAMLSGGLKYKQISITPEESQFLETREFQRGEIAMLFGIPPHMIGDTQKSTSWGSGIEQQSIGFVTYTLRPWLTCIESAMTTLLPRGQFFRFNVDGLLRGDQKARHDAYTQARNAGWMNVDEIRALEDLPPVPDGRGQDFLQPLNMGPLGSDPLAAKGQMSDED